MLSKYYKILNLSLKHDFFVSITDVDCKAMSKELKLIPCKITWVLIFLPHQINKTKKILNNLEKLLFLKITILLKGISLVALGDKLIILTK